jgi:hypothetical protein
MKWLRVSKQNPCAVCGKPDWCTYTHDGLACCMRVQSDRPSPNGGWFHRDPQPTPYTPPVAEESPRPTCDAPALLGKGARETHQDALGAFATRLGVDCASLVALNAARAACYAAWAFPMADGQGNLVGIRLRADSGHKWAVPGSRQGIFLPNIIPQDVALIPEGPTDTAAALSLGFFAVGRPSCNTGGLQIAATVRRLGVRRVVMVADNDTPGRQGAARVAGEIALPHITFIPPCKDLRQFVQAGGTRLDVENSIANSLWQEG